MSNFCSMYLRKKNILIKRNLQSSSKPSCDVTNIILREKQTHTIYTYSIYKQHDPFVVRIVIVMLF